jgi:hypothetical protein
MKGFASSETGDEANVRMNGSIEGCKKEEDWTSMIRKQRKKWT